MAGAEAIDARVLQKAADNALDPDALGKSWDSRPQAADTAHHEVNFHSSLAGLIEGVDDSRVDERVHFHPDGRVPPGPDVLDLVLNVLENAGPDALRTGGHRLDLGGFCIAGDEIENARDVASDDRIRCEE